MQKERHTKTKPVSAVAVANASCSLASVSVFFFPREADAETLACKNPGDESRLQGFPISDGVLAKREDKSDAFTSSPPHPPLLPPFFSSSTALEIRVCLPGVGPLSDLSGFSEPPVTPR